MYRLYKEHPEFNEYVKFDLANGQVIPITENDFKRLSMHHETFIGPSVPTHTNFPRRVYFQITRQCTLLCDFCFIKADINQPHLDTSVVISYAKYLGTKGLMEVRLTGGEPTLHPDFIKICEVFQKSNVYVSIGTNGLWTSKVKDFLKRQKSFFIVVSIDGSKESHNFYRNNSYEKIISNLRELRAANQDIRIRINTVLTKRNRYDLEALCQLTKSLHADNITLLPLRSQVRIPSIKDERLSAQEFKEVIQEMIQYKKKYDIQFTTALGAEFKNEIKDDNVFARRSSCAAGREGTNLDFDVNRRKMLMYACSYCSASDLHDTSPLRKLFLAGEIGYECPEQFESIWNDSSRWIIFRDLNLKPHRCQNCDEFTTLCTGACPVQNVAYSSLNLDDESNIETQVIKLMQNTKEWYCYKEQPGGRRFDDTI